LGNFACIKRAERHKGFVSLLISILVITSAGCNSDQQHKAGGTHEASASNLLRRGLGGEPASLDPAQAADAFSFEILRELYEGLATEASDGTVVPGVADSWITNSSGTRYQFHLRQDARWSNGDHVRAQDFVRAWRRVVDPTIGSPVADILRPILNASSVIAGRLPPASLGVSAPQDDVLIVDLELPAPYFPEVLTHSATFPVFSALAVNSHNQKSLVTNGPYMLTSWTPGNSINLTKNMRYWDQSNVRIPNVAYTIIVDENSEFMQYRANQIDVTQNVPSSALTAVKAQWPNELYVAPYLGTAYYSFNLKSSNALKSLDLRTALTMALDRKLLVSTILPFGQAPAYGFVPAGIRNYTPQSWSWKSLPDAARIEHAKQLYHRAGYSIQKPLHIRMLLSTNSSIKQMAIAIASNWRQTLGVETEITEEEFRVFLQSRKDTSRWDVVRLGWTADYNDAATFLEIFRKDSANNDSGYANRAYDSLLDKAAGAQNVDMRASILESAERLLLSDYAVVPIYFFSSKRLVKPYVKGVKMTPLNKLYSRHLSFDARRSD